MDKKICKVCKVEKCFNEYYKNKNYKKDGHDSTCKECRKNGVREANKERHKANKERYNKVSREYYNKNKDIILQYQKEYRENNKEALILVQKNKYEKYKEAILSQQKQYRQTEAGKLVTLKKEHKRRITEKGVQWAGNYTLGEWKECLKFFNNCDAYTGEPLGVATKDHVVPISKGGLNTINNLVPCNAPINSSKGAKDWVHWYRAQAYYSKDRELKIKEWINK